MAYELKAFENALKYAKRVVAIPGTLKNTGVTADSDGRKIVPAGTALESASSGTIIASGDAARVCTDYSGSSAEVILQTDIDVTDGDKTASFLINGTIDGAACPHFKYGAVAALKANGLNIIGSYTQEANPALTFTCSDHATAASTRIASVSPTLTSGNSYVVGNLETTAPNVYTNVFAVGHDMTGETDYAAYTLADAIAAANADHIVLYEIDGDGLVIKYGTAAAVVA